MTIKVFGADIPQRLSKDYSDFSALNDTIEKDSLSPDDVKEAYHAVLLETLSTSEKQNVHWQIQYLTDEIKVPVNTILSFIDAKFSSFEDALDGVIAGTEFRRAINLNQLKEIISNMGLVGLLDMNVKKLTTMETVFNYSIDLSEDDTPEARLKKTEQALLEMQEHMGPGNGLYLNPLVMDKGVMKNK